MSKYSIDRSADGFTVTGGKTPVTVTLNSQGTAIQVQGTYSMNFGLWMSRNISQNIAQRIMHDWTDPNPDRENNIVAESFIRAWAIAQTTKAINYRVYAEVAHLRDQCDPQIVAVQKAFLCALGTTPTYVTERYFPVYKSPDLIKDVLRYRAASIALDSIHHHQNHDFENWRGYFAPSNTPYRSLNLTLDHLPGLVPRGVLENLKVCQIKRPLYTRLEIMASSVGCILTRHQHTFFHATPEEIRRACKMVLEEKGTHWALKNNHLRNANRIMRCLRYIGDYPNKHDGRLPALAEKSIRWHRQIQHDQVNASTPQWCQERMTMLTATPPISLPQSSARTKIRFLETVGDYVTEGIEMGHCIANYAQLAVAGSCYTFHVEYANTKATVQLSDTGYVTEALGPDNYVNKASQYGQRLLSKWGRQMRAAPTTGWEEEF